MIDRLPRLLVEPFRPALETARGYNPTKMRHDAVAGLTVAVVALGGPERCTTLLVIFAFAADVIFAAAEPFAAGLVQTGKSAGIDEFILVQWVAPLASE